jgi:hypothetical protein
MKKDHTTGAIQSFKAINIRMYCRSFFKNYQCTELVFISVGLHRDKNILGWILVICVQLVWRIRVPESGLCAESVRNPALCSPPLRQQGRIIHKN